MTEKLFYSDQYLKEFKAKVGSVKRTARYLSVQEETIG